MSDILYSIKKSNKNEKYQHETGVEVKGEDIDRMTSNFMQELVTDAGSVLFDKKYGTTFLTDIKDQVNIHKVRYLLENGYQSTKGKYGILSVETNDVFFDKKDGFLNIVLTLIFSGFKADTSASFIYNGTFTTKTIIEVEK